MNPKYILNYVEEHSDRKCHTHEDPIPKVENNLNNTHDYILQEEW